MFSELFLYISILLLIYCFMLVHDLVAISGNKKKHLVTTLGKILGAKRETDNFRISQLKALIESERVDPKATILFDDRSASEGGVQVRFIESVVKAIPQSDVLLIYPSKKGLQLFSSKRLSQELKKHLVSRFYECGREEKLKPRIVDEQSGAAVVNTMQYGYRYIMKQPILCEGSELGVAILLTQGNVPPEIEQFEWLEKTIQTYEKLFDAQKKVTHLKSEIKEVRRIEKSRGQQIAHISHDIRSPLNNIKAALEILALDISGGTHKDLLDVCLASCDNLNHVVESVLDLTRWQCGELKARKEKIEIVSIVKNILNSFRLTADLNKLALSLEAPDRLYIGADKSHIYRIVTNLLSNALKYTKQGGVTIAIREMEGVISIEISDTGVGISEEQQKKLFTAFSRFSPDLADGIGLGLPLTKILTEINGGRIKVQSIEGSGTSVSVRFPSSFLQESRESQYQTRNKERGVIS